MFNLRHILSGFGGRPRDTPIVTLSEACSGVAILGMTGGGKTRLIQVLTRKLLADNHR